MSADTLYNNSPAEREPALPATREATLAERLYGVGGGSLEGVDLEPLHDALQVPHDSREDSAREFRQALGELGFDGREAEELVGVINAAVRRPPDDRERLRWEEQSRRFLSARYGESWQADLKQAQQLLRRVPGLPALLARTGAGDHPRVVELVMSKRGRVG